MYVFCCNRRDCLFFVHTHLMTWHLQMSCRPSLFSSPFLIPLPTCRLATHINSRLRSLFMLCELQEVLKSVRSADKFCVDIMCILLLLGMIAVLYAVIRNT